MSIWFLGRAQTYSLGSSLTTSWTYSGVLDVYLNLGCCVVFRVLVSGLVISCISRTLMQFLIVSIFLKRASLSYKPRNTTKNQQTNQSTNQPTNPEPTNQPTVKQTNKPTNQQTNKPTNHQTNQHTNQPTNQHTNQPTNQQTNQPTNQLLQPGDATPTRMGQFLNRQIYSIYYYNNILNMIVGLATYQTLNIRLMQTYLFICIHVTLCMWGIWETAKLDFDTIYCQGFSFLAQGPCQWPLFHWAPGWYNMIC